MVMTDDVPWNNLCVKSSFRGEIECGIRVGSYLM